MGTRKTKVNNENSIAITPATPATPAVKGKGKKVATPAAKGKTTPAAKGKKVATPTARTTKKGDAIELLRKGISLEKLMDKFGWQRHTVRGFISVLGKTHKIESTSVDGARTYKISGGK